MGHRVAADRSPPVPLRDADVRAAFNAVPPQPRARLLALRARIFAVADRRPEVGALLESLRWGEPAYLTPSSRSGSTIRLGWKADDPATYALLVHCRTSLASTFRALYPDELTVRGDRAIVFPVGQPLPHPDAVDHCIELALTYTRWKRGPAPQRRR